MRFGEVSTIPTGHFAGSKSFYGEVPTNVGGAYILKPSPLEYPEGGENEHVSMLIGQKLGIETPPCGLISFSNGELAYIVKRFDREQGNKINQEDMAQILNKVADKTGSFKYDSNYEEVGRTIYKVTGENRAVVLRFFERLIYNFIIHNDDWHLKNISLVGPDREGRFEKLTPLYDSVNTTLLLKNRTYFALKSELFGDGFQSKKRDALGYPTSDDFEELGNRLGLPKKSIDAIFAKLKAGQGDVEELIQDSFLGTSSKNKYLVAVKDRYTMLQR